MIWKILPFNEESFELVKNLDVHPIVGQLLLNRGITDPKKAEKFLFPSLNDLPNPFIMKGMERAVKRVIKAIFSREKITIYGDYDVDGITSIALIKKFFSELGIQVDHYIPKRIEEGYGLNAEAIKSIASRGTKLLITVDCGITNVDEVALANSLGLEVIIIDHHEVPDRLPEATILNPLQKDCPFHFKELAAVGVVFLFLMALRKSLREMGFFKGHPQPNLKRYLDLVALGTVGDVVPVIGENRLFIYFGLQELQNPKRPGLKALMEKAGLPKGPFSYEEVAFRITPRLNAGGRMQKEEVPLRLLLSEDEEEALKLASELEEANSLRQALQERIYSEARQMALQMSEEPALILASETWHEGVIGIVASKLVEEFYKPTILIALNGDRGKGSGRGIPEVHLRELLKRCENHLMGFGGHKGAAGFKIKRDELEAFILSFKEALKDQLGERCPSPSLIIDMALSLKEITPSLMEGIERLMPFGPGNPVPLFCSKEVVSIENLRVFEKNVTRFSVIGKGARHEAVLFNNSLSSLPPKAQIAFTPRKDLVEGYIKLSLEIKGVREFKPG
jgi:single-stranded-DNA-specific exonuclease